MSNGMSACAQCARGVALFLTALTLSTQNYASGSFSTLAGYFNTIEISGYASLADAAIASCEITNTLSPPVGFQCEPTFSLHPNWATRHFPDNIGDSVPVQTGFYTNATYWTNSPPYATHPYFPIAYYANTPPKIKDLGAGGGGGCLLGRVQDLENEW